MYMILEETSGLLNLTYEDLLQDLEKQAGNLEYTDSKTTALQMINCCFLANHIPEWIWSAASNEQKTKWASSNNNNNFPNEAGEAKKVFLKWCRKNNEFYQVIKDICNTSKHVRLNYKTTVRSTQSMVNIDPEFQYFMDTGKNFTKDDNGEYLFDGIPEIIPVNQNLTEIFITYENSQREEKNDSFKNIIMECIKYQHKLAELFLQYNISSTSSNTG